MNFYHLKKLQLHNFRNINESIIEFSEGINCLFGDNGNGKTNILEAIYYLCTKKSFRKNTSFPQLLSVNCEKPEILINSVFHTENNTPTSISTKITSSESTWAVNSKMVKSKPKIAAVFINPFDSYSFHTLPAFRRTWFDQNIAKISDDYKSALNKYTQNLRMRNNLLSNKPNHFKEQINAIDPSLAYYSKILIDKRREFINQIQQYCAKTFQIIFEESHDLRIDIESKFKTMTQEDILEFYKKTLEKDIIIGHTSYGVHKDDYVFHFDGFNSFDFCSLGQQKMSYLSLIFAYIELFRYKFSSYPIVLIDDVSGELDQKRWKNLIDYLEVKKFQVMITTANENFKNELEKITNSNKLNVANGNVERA